MVVIYNLMNCLNRALYWLHRRSRNPRQLLFIVVSVSLMLLAVWKLYPAERVLIPRWHSINSATSILSHKLNLAVIEEHHEALAYWFEAANRGIIRKHGNTLIHVDSHPDLALLTYDEHMSWFRFPDTPTQVASLIQNNDQFITGAMMTGLVSDVLWIYPDWVDVSLYNKVRLNEDGSFNDNISIGWYIYKGKPALCYCFRSDNQCEYKNSEGGEVESTLECTRMIAAKFTIVKASNAHPFLERATKTSYILDIDEDFYGVARGSDLLAGVDWWKIQELDEILAHVFQPLSVYEEVAAHDIMKDIFHQILKVCLSNGAERRRCQKEHVLYINKYLAESGHFNRPIGGGVIYTLKISNLIDDICELFEEREMQIIQEVGFCLNISPNTWRIHGDDARTPALTVCHGVNTPNTSNQIRVFDELTESKRVIGDLVDTLSKSAYPGLVTVARSNRDGFVPRRQQADIETNLLNVLASNFRDSHVIYDRSLMTHLGQDIITV